MRLRVRRCSFDCVSVLPLLACMLYNTDCLALPGISSRLRSTILISISSCLALLECVFECALAFRCGVGVHQIRNACMMIHLHRPSSTLKRICHSWLRFGLVCGLYQKYQGKYVKLCQATKFGQKSRRRMM